MSRKPKSQPAECCHHFNVDSNNIGTCSLCGEVRKFPYGTGQDVEILKKGRKGDMKKNHHRGIHAKAAYHLQNKDAIIQDILATGPPATRRKWGMPPSTIHTLIHKWLTPAQRMSLPRRRRHAAPEAPPGSHSSNGQLPHFPEFSGTWEASVQLKWLEIYENLHHQRDVNNARP